MNSKIYVYKVSKELRNIFRETNLGIFRKNKININIDKEISGFKSGLFLYDDFYQYSFILLYMYQIGKLKIKNKEIMFLFDERINELFRKDKNHYSENKFFNRWIQYYDIDNVIEDYFFNYRKYLEYFIDEIPYLKLCNDLNKITSIIYEILY